MGLCASTRVVKASPSKVVPASIILSQSGVQLPDLSVFMHCTLVTGCIDMYIIPLFFIQEFDLRDYNIDNNRIHDISRCRR